MTQILPNAIETGAFDEGFRTIEDDGDIVAPRLIALYESWNIRRGGNRFAPTGHDLMLEFPAEAALWTICDVQDGGVDFHYRFVGSGVVTLIGGEITGRTLSELNAASGEQKFGTNTMAICRLLVATGLPVLNGPKSISIEDKSYLRIQTLNLPLGGGGPFPEQILAAIELIRAPDDDKPL